MMLAEGEKYRFTWDDGADYAQAYEYYTVISQEGTVVHAVDDNGKEAVINMTTVRFMRADPWP